MNILLLAGTGTLGKHISDLLNQRGERVVITSRSPRISHEENIHYIQGNIHDMDFLESVVNEEKRWDVIIDFMVYSTDEFKEKVDLYLKYSSQYIFFSSARVYADSDRLLTEESPRLLDVSIDSTYLRTDDYALCKARQENVLLSAKSKNYTIIRPYITYGEDRLQLGIQEHETWLRRVLNNKAIIIEKEIADSITTLTYAGDVAQAVCELIGNKLAFGQIYLITVSECLKWNDVLNIYLKVIEEKLHLHPKIKYVKMEKNSTCYQARYDRMFTRRFDNSKIASFVEVDSFVSPYVGLKSCLEKFLDHPVYRNFPINWKNEALLDQMGGDFSPLSAILGKKNKMMYLFFRYVPYKWLPLLRTIKKLIK